MSAARLYSRRPPLDSFAFALAAGALLGVATRLVYELPHEWWWLAKVGMPWLATAFAVATVTARPRRGALLGAAALVAATLVYYAILGLVQHRYWVSPLGLGWLWVAVPGGALFGALGAAWRGGRLPVLSVAVLTASFAGEGLLFGLLVHHPGQAGTWLVAVALALPVAMLRGVSERVRALALAGVLAGAAIAAEGAVLVATSYIG